MQSTTKHKVWTANNKYDVEDPSAETNGELRLSSMTEQQKPQVMPNNEGRTQDST